MADAMGTAIKPAGKPVGKPAEKTASPSVEPPINRIVYFLRKILNARIFVGHVVARLRSLGRDADAVDQIGYLMADRRSIARAEALGLVDRAFVDATVAALHAEFAAVLERHLAGGGVRVAATVGALSPPAVVGQADFVRKSRTSVIAKGMVAVDQSVVFHAAEAALRRAVAGLCAIDGHRVAPRVDADLRFMAGEAVARDLKNAALASPAGVDESLEVAG